MHGKSSNNELRGRLLVFISHAPNYWDINLLYYISPVSRPKIRSLNNKAPAGFNITCQQKAKPSVKTDDYAQWQNWNVKKEMTHSTSTWAKHVACSYKGDSSLTRVFFNIVNTLYLCNFYQKLICWDQWKKTKWELANLRSCGKRALNKGGG